MGKQLILIIIGLIVLLLVGGFIITNNPNNIKINDVKFKAPDTYEVSDGADEVKLTNGKDSIIIVKNTTTKLKKTVDNYIHSKEKKNDTVKLSNMTINNNVIYRVSVDNTNIVHYWFEKNGKVFEIYTKNANPNTELAVTDLIKSTDSII